MAPAFYLMGAAIVSFLTLLSLRETVNARLE
jgi:hypothetical protein